jgi:P-type Mg2+ transporter
MLSNLNSSTRHDENFKRGRHSIQVSPVVTKVAQLEAPEALATLETSSAGLTQDEAQARLIEYGPNVVAAEKQRGWLWRLFTATRNLLVILLTVLATISFATGDYRAGTVILLMVVLGVSLRFVQESRADAAAAKLKAMISVTAAVLRDGSAKEIAIKDLVPGDIVHLCAGDMIPADVRLISSKDLFVAQASLTGESLPVEKFESCEARADIPPFEVANICFLGTSVESGSATAVVAARVRIL